MRRIREIMWGLVRQPLMQFLALGGLVFLIFSGAGDASPDADTIIIDAPLRERLSMLYQAQLGAYPSQEDMDGLVERHVREEMLYREALRLGLDRDDEIIRRRLVQKMEYLAEADALPDEAALRDFYAQDPARFAAPAQVSFRQLYFSPDSGGWDAARDRARAALATSAPRGEPFVLEAEYQLMGPQDASQTFGDSDFADALFRAPVGAWSGPYRSGYGWHLVRVTQRRDADVQPFDAVADQVALVWAEDNRSRQLDAMIADLEARYKVERR